MANLHRGRDHMRDWLEASRHARKTYLFGIALLTGCSALHAETAVTVKAPGANPIITDAFTADPSPLVVGDTVYLYTTHDIAEGDVLYAMNDWLVYSSKDLRKW